MFLPQNPFLCDSICESAHLPCLTLLLASVSLSCCGKQSAGDLVTSNSGRFFALVSGNTRVLVEQAWHVFLPTFASLTAKCLLAQCHLASSWYLVKHVFLFHLCPWKLAETLAFMSPSAAWLWRFVYGRPHAVHANSAS